MNSKKNKHKKPNKMKPNVVKTEDEVVITEGDLEIVEKEHPDDEKSVSQVQSEVVSMDTNVVDVEIPKKPKRSKGKKKKSEDADAGDSENVVIQTTESNITMTDSAATDIVLPLISMNKEEKVEQNPISDISLLVEEPKTETIETPLLECVESTEIELKQSKKKNKKRKQRNDSEISDKSGEVTCNSAFQVLLETDDKNVYETETVKEAESEVVKETHIVEEKSALAEDGKKKTESTIISPSCKDNVIGEIVDESKHEKNKKKNKKDKKRQFKDEDNKVEPLTDADKENLSSTKVIYASEGQVVKGTDDQQLKKQDEKTIEMCVELQSSSEYKQQFVQEIEAQEKLPSEEEIKLKAKIAKPVEKKKKNSREKQNPEIAESVIEKENTTEMKYILNIQSQNQPLLEEKQDDIKICAYSVNQPEPNLEEIVLKPQEMPPIQAVTMSFSESSDDKEFMTKKNKKKKKGPKHPENTDDVETSKKTDLKIDVELLDNVLDVKNEETQNIGTLKITSDSESNAKSIPLQSFDSGIIKTSLDSDLKESSENSTSYVESSSKRKKKGKKYPVAPLAIEETTEIESNLGTIEAITFESEIKNLGHNQEQSTLIPTQELTEGSSCPIKVFEESSTETPEITYSRSTSQQLLDGNNNMIIREIVNEGVQCAPLFVPSNVEGSGESPTSTPVMVSSDIKITEIETKSEKSSEKTDLKSKMVEVNKDMEELRLSIERSLAELTALEKFDDISNAKNETQITAASECSMIPPARNPSLDMTITDEAVSDSSNQQSLIESLISPVENPLSPTVITGCEIIAKELSDENKKSVSSVEETLENKSFDVCTDSSPPICPARKDNKGKGKKKKGRHEISTTSQPQSTSATENTEQSKESKKEEEKAESKQEEKKSGNTGEKGKQQSNPVTENDSSTNVKEQSMLEFSQTEYEPIDNFEDALSSNVDDDSDVNKTFEMIVHEVTDETQKELAASKPVINVTAVAEDSKKENPISQPKNLLGQPDFPVSSNKTDYKKEKNKTPNTKQAKVKIKDSVEIEAGKQSKESQTLNKKAKKELSNLNESFSQVNQNEDFIYKYSFRRVFLQSACHVCKKDVTHSRFPCKFCNLVFYCSAKHKDEDWSQHQALCFAVSTIGHLKDQKHIYADAKTITGHNYRLLRMQMILSCEKVLKRRLVPWEQEALLYPRMCADIWCREWRQKQLKDCDACEQISFCADNPDHLPKTHQRWCKSYSLYQKLVTHQQTKGRLDPKLPTKVMKGQYVMPEKINEVLATMYEEKIDMNDIEYAALTQIATAPLSAAYAWQVSCPPNSNGFQKKTNFTIHVVGAELQFEADALNKWEVFFLHLLPEVKNLKIVLIGNDLNPGNLPLDLLGKIRVCEDCSQSKRCVTFNFHDRVSYTDHKDSVDFEQPDLICAFNPSIDRSSVFNGKDPWPTTLKTVMRLKAPLLVTAHTITELHRDLARIKQCAQTRTILDPKHNPYASVRPDRNFISDDEMPLLFKNYSFMILSGV